MSRIIRTSILIIYSMLTLQQEVNAAPVVSRETSNQIVVKSDKSIVSANLVYTGQSSELSVGLGSKPITDFRGGAAKSRLSGCPVTATPSLYATNATCSSGSASRYRGSIYDSGGGAGTGGGGGTWMKAHIQVCTLCTGSNCVDDSAPPSSTKVATCKDSVSNASKNNCGYAASQIAASCTPSTVGMYYKVITNIGQGGVSIDVFSCNAPNWTYL